jgi:hypothetical protein
MLELLVDNTVVVLEALEHKVDTVIQLVAQVQPV